MVHLLFTVLFAEVALVLLLMVKSPLRKLAIAGLDQVKQGRGPVIVKTLCGIVFVLLISSIHSIVRIQNRLFNFGATEPTDHILMGRHLLEASLMGCSIFLMIVVDRLHYYIRELHGMRKTIEYSKKQVVVFREEAKKLLEDEISSLRARVKQLELESKEWEREAKNAEANAEALRKQSEGFLLEYDRLLEDNQSLRNQLQLIDRRLSRSNSRKNS